MNSLVDCQCGVLHHPSTLCVPGGVKGSRLCFVHPQVCVQLCWFLLSSEVHCGVNDATRFLWETNSIKRRCCVGGLEQKHSIRVTMTH